MLAAIDLGSNSFHMVLARVVNGQVQVIDQRGEKVMLASGLDPKTGISEDAQERAIACLERFSQHLRGFEKSQVVILGTNTLRAARNSQVFMERAETALGFPIEVISGVEEARLVYLGVAHTLADDDGKRLVIDIGGGSTEFIIGERFKPIIMESLHMGCVSYSDRYFKNGTLNELNFRQAIAGAHRELLSIKGRYRNIGWQNVVGSSGTMRAVKRVLEANDLSEDGITLKALYALEKIILRHDNVEELELNGIKGKRISVFPAGLAILIAIFEALEIDVLEYSDGALREGALHDLLGRVTHEDVRENTVAVMQKRFVVDLSQAQNVKQSASILYKQVCEKWKLDSEIHLDSLRWAADLHEVGLAIAHNQYHKHGAYMLQFSDMPGFSKQSQEVLSTLVRCHRRKLPAVALNGFNKKTRNAITRLSILLRLAVILHHGRGLDEVTEPRIEVNKTLIKLQFPEGYLSDHAMTELDLEREREALKSVDYDLSFK